MDEMISTYRNRSWPAVSQSCSFIRGPLGICIVLAKKSTPTVGSET